MFSTKLIRTLVLAAAGAAVGTAAFAIPHPAAESPLGYAAPDARAQRTIDLRGDAKYANIEQGETVRFITSGGSFAWTFDTLGTPAFSLSSIAPKDVAVGSVTVYVAPNRLYNM